MGHLGHLQRVQTEDEMRENARMHKHRMEVQLSQPRDNDHDHNPA